MVRMACFFTGKEYTKTMKDLLHPSLLQINYLMTLEKIEKKRINAKI